MYNVQYVIAGTEKFFGITAGFLDSYLSRYWVTEGLSEMVSVSIEAIKQKRLLEDGDLS